MKEKLLRFRKKQKYLIFDYETCNLNLIAGDNKPWQLAFIATEGDKILDQQDYWLKWDDLNVSPEAAKITGFSKTKYNKKATDPQKALDHLETYLYDDDYIKVGHNLLGFDVYMHGICRRLIGKQPDYSYLRTLIDTLCLSRAINNDIALQKEDDFLQWQYKMLSLRRAKGKNKLIDLCRQYDIKFNPKKLHDALYDIEKNYAVFKKLIWNIEV